MFGRRMVRRVHKLGFARRGLATRVAQARCCRSGRSCGPGMALRETPTRTATPAPRRRACRCRTRNQRPRPALDWSGRTRSLPLCRSGYPASSPHRLLTPPRHRLVGWGPVLRSSSQRMNQPADGSFGTPVRGCPFTNHRGQLPTEDDRSSQCVGLLDWRTTPSIRTGSTRTTPTPSSTYPDTYTSTANNPPDRSTSGTAETRTSNPPGLDPIDLARLRG